MDRFVRSSLVALLVCFFGACGDGGDLAIIADASPNADGGGDPGRPDADLLPCYSGPEGTQDIGLCTGGLDTGGECSGEVLPATETCDDQDQDCDGAIDEDEGGATLTQACYTGPMGTEGVGPCVAGTATCSEGAFGVCQNQIIPAMETCNGADEDCSGAVDNGCPTAIATVAGGTSDPFGAGGGTEFSETCPAGQVLVGIKGRATNEVRQLQPVCGTLTLVETRDVEPYIYSINRTDANDGTAIGSASGSTFSFVCPENEVVSGVGGRADTRVDAIAVTCSSLSIAGSAGAFTVTRVAGSSSSEFGGAGGNPFTFTCPMDEVAATVSGSFSSQIDSVAIACVSVDLTLL